MDEHSINPKTAGFMDIIPCRTAASRHSFTSRAGLMVPAVLLERLGLGETVDGRMPGPGSNRGYRHGMIFDTFMPTSHEGAECPEDVRHRHGEHALTGLMGLRPLPSAWQGRRAGTFRYRLYAMAGQVVRHARQWTLKVGPARPGLLEETLWRMRTCRLFRSPLPPDPSMACRKQPRIRDRFSQSAYLSNWIST